MTEVWVVQDASEDCDPIVMCVCEDRELAIEMAKGYVRRDNDVFEDDEWTLVVEPLIGGFYPDAVCISDGGYSSCYNVFMEPLLTHGGE